MKTYVFIFVPVVIERTEIRFGAAATPDMASPSHESTGDDSYPFWTWFMENPRPKPLE